ncbi:MAG: OsmC family protein [Deltaproteobacteria bacterium]|nr:OsmC family protein [Deltaproteobacteria bacterium]
MTQINLEYLGDLDFKAVHGPSGAAITTDAPPDNQGKGRSFSPTDLLATSLGACMGTIMGIVARRDQIDLSGMKITVVKEMTKTTPRKVAELKVQFEIPKLVKAEERVKLERAALTCPVHHSLHPDVKISVNFNWSRGNS